MSNWTEVQMKTLVLHMDQRQRGGTNNDKNYNSIQFGGPWCNNQPTEAKYVWGERNRCKRMNWGQESGFDDILMNGHTQKTWCHTKTKVQHRWQKWMGIHTQQSTSPRATVLWQNRNEEFFFSGWQTAAPNRTGWPFTLNQWKKGLNPVQKLRYVFSTYPYVGTIV